MKYHVKIRAQVEWSTTIEADTQEEAEQQAKDDFEFEIDSEMTVACFNDVTAVYFDEQEGGGE